MKSFHFWVHHVWENAETFENRNHGSFLLIYLYTNRILFKKINKLEQLLKLHLQFFFLLQQTLTTGLLRRLNLHSSSWFHLCGWKCERFKPNCGGGGGGAAGGRSLNESSKCFDVWRTCLATWTSCSCQPICFLLLSWARLCWCVLVKSSQGIACMKLK